jgi:hypothetical protein
MASAWHLSDCANNEFTKSGDGSSSATVFVLALVSLPFGTRLRLLIFCQLKWLSSVAVAYVRLV